MNDDLIQRLLFAETDFLAALQRGPRVLGSYGERLSALSNTVSAAAKTGGAGNDTLSLAYSVASRILNVASCFLRVRREEETFTAQLRTDWDIIVHRMNALNLNVQPKNSDSDNNSDTLALLPTPVLDTASSSLPVLSPACQWLLDNLHNPYPPAKIKIRLATASSCRVSSINSWFINARRRIGWTALCREHFSNRRADMIDAAYRALVEEDPRRMLSPELRHSFIAMKVAAEGLYSSTLTSSKFARDLDIVVKDAMEGSRTSIECCQVEKVDFTKTVQDSYPSPDRSSAMSPVPALGDFLTSENGEENVPSPTTTGSKRRRPSIESADQPSSLAKRPMKRLRASTPKTHLPSPPSSTVAADVPSGDDSPKHFSEDPTQSKTNVLLPYRKRRLSDPDATEASKRPRGSVASPCPHIVLNTLPRSDTEIEHSVDDWFNTNFDALFAIPPPVDAAEPDSSVPWEVELFNDYSIPGNSKHAPRHSPTPTVGPQMPAPIDASDFESLLQSIGGDSFAPTSESVFPSDTTGAHMVSLNSSIPDTSQTNLDWTSLLSTPDAHQPATYSIPSQYLVDSQLFPEIDPSTLHMLAVSPQGDFASRHVKLHRLHAMQKAVRQMEQELQAEGIVV